MSHMLKHSIELQYRNITKDCFQTVDKIIRIAKLRKTTGAQENYLSLCHYSILTKVSFKKIFCGFSYFFTSEIKLQF